MGRAGFNRKTAYATLAMTLAAEVPDLDIVWLCKGPIAGFEHHRGITHTFVAAPFIAAMVLGFVYCVDRMRLWRRPPQEHAPRVCQPHWRYLYFLALLATLSHLLLDYTTAYGVRPFEPFSYRWYSWNIVSIIEPLIFLVLLAGLVMPSLFGLINQEIGARQHGPRGRGWAIFALVCLVLIWGFRDYQHRRAINALNALLYRGEVPRRVAAYPYWINPFRWHGVVETTDFFQTLPVNSLTPEVDPQSLAVTLYKPEETAVTQAAKSSYLGRAYLDWAAFPVTETQKLEGDEKGYLVIFRDLRYVYPETTKRAPLAGYVVLSPMLQVEEEGTDIRKAPLANEQRSEVGNR